MSSSSEVTKFLNRSKYPIISGFFAFLAGFAGKHAFSDDIGGLKEYSIVNLVYYLTCSFNNKSIASLQLLHNQGSLRCIDALFQQSNDKILCSFSSGEWSNSHHGYELLFQFYSQRTTTPFVNYLSSK